MSEIHLLVGSTLGGTEYVADALADKLREAGHEPQLHLTPNLHDLPLDGTWLICSATHGAGELPDNIQPFGEQLAEKPDLRGVRFAVFAIGDTNYDSFCQGGKVLEAAMLDCGAHPLWPRIDIDVMDPELPEDQASAWLDQQIGKL
ncbi:FMN-binding protein MioC [Gallaecimonas kandeliae]|uniref:FMN-binding protein MioC n=1 Tax=Gallaecimonas kandeliae TaxID=3029055 RepID=UPI00300FC7A5